MESELNKGDYEQGKLLSLTTNEVLIEEKKNRIIYYLPCYVRFKVKEVCEIKIEKLLGVVTGTLLFSFYYGDLPNNILEQFTGEKQEKAILLQSKQSIELREDKGIIYKQDAANKVIDYVIRTEFDCHLKGDVFLTPFEIVNLCMSMTVQSVVLDPKSNDGRRIDIKFNCMNSDRVTVIDHGENIQFGNYRLADHFLDCDYHNSATSRFLPISTLNPDVRIKKQVSQDNDQGQNASVTLQIKKANEDSQTTNVKLMGSATPSQLKKIEVLKKRKEKSDSESKINNFQYVHFRIPLYKYPCSNLLSIFLPLWVLAFINLTIYFQDISFAGRLAVIATITLAFVAFLPTINDKIPQSSVVKFVQILIYLEIGSTILTIIEGLTVKGKDPTTWTFVWSESPYFVITLVLNILSVALVFGLFLVHKFFWEKVYLRKKEKKITQRLVKQNWQNKQCDEYFKEFLTSNRITYIQPSFPAIKIKSSQ